MSKVIEDLIELKPETLEHIAMSQALLSTAGKRRQANALLREAIEHERSIAQKIMGSLGWRGEAVRLSISDKGELEGIVFQYEEDDEEKEQRLSLSDIPIPEVA